METPVRFINLAAVGCLVLSLILCTGCDHEDRISRLEKQVSGLRSDVDKTSAERDFDLQAKCAKDARLWFNENWSKDKDSVFLDFTNHYNKSSNSCLIS